MTNDGMKYGIHAGRVASGLIVLALGALMLLDRHDVFGRDTMHFFPGVVLVVLGAVRLLWGDGMRRRRRAGFGGFWLVLVGAWLIANESHLLGLTYHDSWPILIIGVGVLIVLRELVGPDGGRPTDDPAGLPQR